MNYESFFGFQNRPFAPTPNVQSYFAAESIETARKTLIRTVERGAGAGLVIGPPGSGKSLLLQVLAHQLHGRFELASLTDGHAPATRRELLQSILFELELPYRGFDEGELRLSLIDHLARGLAGVPLLILVDDAQHLAVELLEEIRLLADVARSGAPRVRVILAGTAALEEKFAHPTLEAFSQRLAARAYLASMTREETQGYVTAKLTQAGGSVFGLLAGDAVDQIYRATDGVPRLVNQVCDHALVLAASRGQRKLDGSLIQEAWSELQQLPAPWNSSLAGETSAMESDNVIEFGGLDEAPLAKPAEKSAKTAKPTPAAFEIEEPAASFELELRDEPVQSVLKLAAKVVPVAAPVREEPRLRSVDSKADALRPTRVKPVAPVMEEEVIIDRYAALDAGRVRRPAVYSVEGLELSDLLRLQIQEEKAAPAPALQVVAVEVPAPVSKVDFEVEMTLHEQASAPLALGDEEFEDDEDLIVVEDDLVEHQFGNLSMVSVTPVRREEYRTMFSRMRRGQPQ